MRADRLLSVLMFLQIRGRMTARELAEELEVSERTIYRDIEALNAAGVPVLADRGPGGGCYLPDKYRTDLTGLTEDEARALFLSTVPGPLADLGLDKAVEAAMLKLTVALPSKHRQDVERVRQRFHVDPAQWFRPAEPVPYLKLLQEAVWQDRRLRLDYRTSSGWYITRLLDPYALVAKAGVWYLVGAVMGKVVVYRASRILEARYTQTKFERPEEFDLPSFWSEWCAEFEASLPKYHATLRFSPDLIQQLPMLYGDGIRSEIERAGSPDREGWVTMQMSFERFEAARAQVLGFGTGAEVLEPKELRDSVAQMASRVVEFYRTNQ